MTPGPRTFDHSPFDVAELLEAKNGHRVSVCIPARDEAATLGAVLEAIVPTLLVAGGAGLVDEVLVIDDGSTDETVAIARRAGARVISREAPHGKGRAMRTGIQETHGDLVVFLDADVTGLDERFVTRLLGPLLTADDVVLVKGFYRRPFQGSPTGGGRVTELVAKPALQLLFPELAEIRQPLAGETAALRHVLEGLTLEPGYGVELGLLIDVARTWGASAIGEVDLGVRGHRNRSLEELRPQARDVLAAALERAHPLLASRRSAPPAPP